MVWLSLRPHLAYPCAGPLSASALTSCQSPCLSAQAPSAWAVCTEPKLTFLDMRCRAAILSLFSVAARRLRRGLLPGLCTGTGTEAAAKDGALDLRGARIEVIFCSSGCAAATTMRRASSSSRPCSWARARRASSNCARPMRLSPLPPGPSSSASLAKRPAASCSETGRPALLQTRAKVLPHMPAPTLSGSQNSSQKPRKVCCTGTVGGDQAGEAGEAWDSGDSGERGESGSWSSTVTDRLCQWRDEPGL
mmetsp:Transcript_51074/g.150600  ORF Transcript_51074/g.150600 Transcript_51074/m.150600 type:complete len:250 (-) Transcript_51074:410-1159(-)